MENELRKKKTTAPDTSVGADDGQPLHNSTENSISTFEQEINGDFQNSAESLDEIYRRMQRLTDPHYLHTISMTELYQTAYQSRPPVIDGLLYSGAYILAGAPKIGKSFLVAQIAYHVSTGEALWGYEVHPGTVLYLALEDDFQRIQSRMFMMYGVNDTDRLHFATAAGKIGNGLDEQLDNFVREHPDIKLIAKQFYADAYKAAIEIVGGEQYILSAVMHADERNRAMSDALGQDVYHYHLHVVYIPVVEKQILWSKRCKDKSLVGAVKETITQVSMSKKWNSKPALDENGKPILSANGKPVLKKSYSVLQDDFFRYMRDAGYDDVERGERGSSEEHLTVTQFKVQQEQARLAELTEQNRQQEQQSATLGKQIEKIQNQQVDIAAIEKIEAKSIPFSTKVAVEREDFDRVSTLAKKYVAAEKKESKLQKALDAANKMIAKLKAEIAGLRKELSGYKSVRSKLRASDLEIENAELRGKVRSYEDVIQRNNLWRFFRPHREKTVTRDNVR